MKQQFKKIIVIPDSFKGTLSSLEVCDTMKQSILKLLPNCEVRSFPIADGGEGTVDSFLYALEDAKKVELSASGPFGQPVSCYYARFQNTAIIEMAQTAGLPLVESSLNPRLASTYGVGEMILHAVQHGCTDIIIGLGGSCTNDAGVGCARALGVEFYNSNHEQIIPTADTLKLIDSFDLSKANLTLKCCRITAMCDIDNPMYGERGAAFVFAPQKGADNSCVKELDENLQALSNTITRQLNISVAKLPGAGAAGAMGAGIVAFLGGTLKSGIDTILDLISFDDELSNTDLVFTGEGKIDAQSLGGKVVIGISKRCAKQNVPVIAVVGAMGEGFEGAYELGVSSIFSINTSATAFEIARYDSKKNLAITMDNLVRTLKVKEQTSS